MRTCSNLFFLSALLAADLVVLSDMLANIVAGNSICTSADESTSDTESTDLHGN